MDYKYFKEHLNKEQMPDSVYYSYLYKYRQAILDDISINTQQVVAKSLGMSQAKMSTLAKFMRYI